MRYICFLAILWLFSCKPSAGIVSQPLINDSVTDNEIAAIIDTLSSDYMEGRDFGSKGETKAAAFIENFLVLNKIKPFFKKYTDSVTVSETTGFNVIGLIEGKDEVLKNEYILLSAHYDHVGLRHGQKDSVYNGANDNASGVSTVLNIARQLSLKNTPERSIIVALFTGEEAGLLGAEHFALRIKNSGHKIYCHLNVDMIGSILTDQPGKVYLSGYDKSNMAEIMNRYTGNNAFVKSQKAEMMGVFSLSDNYPIYENLKIPAHTLCTFDFDNYKHYHRTTDEIKNVDIPNTGIIVRNIAKAITGIANSQENEIKLNE